MAAIVTPGQSFDLAGTAAQKKTAANSDIGMSYFETDTGIWYLCGYGTDGTTPTWLPQNVHSVSYAYGVTPIDTVFMVASRALKVLAIRCRPLVVASGATLLVKKAPSATAIASGTALHTENTATGFLLDGTTNVNQSATLSTVAGVVNLAAGDSLGIDVSGTTTNATGVVTVDYVHLA